MNQNEITTACNYLSTAPIGDYYWGVYNWIPYVHPTTTIVYTNQEPSQDLQVRKVENGFIAKHGGKEFVFNTTEQLAKFMTKQLK